MVSYQKALLELRKVAAADSATKVTSETPSRGRKMGQWDEGGEEEGEDEEVIMLGIERVLRPHVRLARLLHRCVI